MYPLAHIASALLVTRSMRLNPDPVPALAGALVPDVIDKTLAWVLGVTPTARHIGHTLLAATVLPALTAPFFGRRRAFAFGAAYLTHLAGDLWDEGHVPWLLPFKRYHERARRWNFELSPTDLGLEALGAAYVLWSATRARRDA